MDFGLRRGGGERYLKQADSGAYVYHYGWVRPPHVMLAKQKNLHSLYYDDAWLESEYKDKKPDDLYNERGHLRFFRGAHPRVMRDIVAQQCWRYDHGIERQWPDWLRHSCFWASHQLWRQFHRVEFRLQHTGRAVTERFLRSSQTAESEE
jgi:hypothetical protein